MVRAVKEILIKAIHDYENANFYIIGSFVNSLSGARDIDILGISPKINSAKVLKEDLLINLEQKPINIQIIPENYFIDDVQKGIYGGYFSTRFALSFKEIIINFKGLNYPEIFWQTMYKYYYYQKSSYPSIEQLIKWIHSETYRHCPTFGRSLCKFIDSKDAKKMLIQSLNGFKYSKNDTMLDKFIVYKGNKESSFFKYWEMYNTFKSNDESWSKQSITKMQYSLSKLSEPKIKEYFE